MLVDIDSDYWDLPVLREAIAAQVWGTASEPTPHRAQRQAWEPELAPVGVSGVRAVAVPAARTGGGRHRRPTPVG